MPYGSAKQFHGYLDEAVRPYLRFWPRLDTEEEVVEKHFVVQERTLTYQFTPHFHPYVTELLERLAEGSVASLQSADTEYVRKADGQFEQLPDGKFKPTLHEELFSATTYNPTDVVRDPEPVKDLDFTSSGAYSVYNWELFFHVPLTIAIHLSRNGRFEEAQRWFHLVFDPTDDSDGPTPERFWKVRPFQYTDVRLIEDILVNLSTGSDPVLRQETLSAINAWKDAPFRPHVVARYRQSAYMVRTVMAYLDNLVAWGDSLFRQDTRETINEALQIYVLAAAILGPRPQPVPRKGSVRLQTYANLRADLQEFGSVLRDLETEIPFDILPHPTDPSDVDRFSSLRSIGTALYFCVPRNDRLLAYWDTVADRLFKIRNSLNLQGTFRQLALFDPPIDPALLAKAAAAGLDVASVVAGANQPLPLVRFTLLAQKAGELCQEVKSLGANLLAAMEKGDGEALSVLRARHEHLVLQLVEHVRYQQWQESIKAREGMEAALTSAFRRYAYYERLLGRPESDIRLPEMDALDRDALEKMRFASTEPEVQPRTIGVDIAPEGGRLISSHERQELEQLSQSQIAQDIGSALDAASSLLNLIPAFSVDGKPLGVGAGVQIGGMNFSQVLSALASASRGVAGRLSFEAGRAAKIGGYARREQEWAFQSNVVAGEMTQTYKQLRAAQIRESIAEREWRNHQRQVANAEDIELFLTDERTGKKTNEAFYTWMQREVRGLYSQAFQLAFDQAKKAERALQQELGDPGLSFIRFDYQSGREGLLAGERLHLDVRRMEMAYQDLNRREYELTKHVSLQQVDPVALLQLRSSGRCTVTLPEVLFDIDGPGHYFRRIRSVAVSIPSVVGPHVSVNCTLTLLKSSIRRTPALRDGAFERQGPEDDRFGDHFGSLQSIVTSSGQNDSGLFETSLRDERLLPFEGSGVISEWQLALPADVPQFDYDTIADVILHVRYTAREGGELLRRGAAGALVAALDTAQAAGSVRLFSMRHEFPTEWARFKAHAIDGDVRAAELAFTLGPEHYPFWSRGRLHVATRVELFAAGDAASVTVWDSAAATGASDDLVGDPVGTLRGELVNVPLPTDPDAGRRLPTGDFRLFLSSNALTDVWLAIRWGKDGV